MKPKTIEEVYDKLISSKVSSSMDLQNYLRVKTNNKFTQDEIKAFYNAFKQELLELLLNNKTISIGYLGDFFIKKQKNFTRRDISTGIPKLILGKKRLKCSLNQSFINHFKFYLDYSKVK
jgi:nucleoid DNA-binding protein